MTTHLILAHLRRTSPSLLPTFQSLLAASAPSISSTFENPLLSSLHSTLVVRGAFGAAEELLDKALEERLFREWSMGGGKGRTVARWERIAGEAGGVRPWPSRRAGHQMVKVGRKILLHGGWTGEEDLGDLWEYELPLTSTSSSGEGAGGGWRCIHPSPSIDDTSTPRSRSCHVLAFDESTGWAYLLGGKLGPEEEEEYEAQMHEHQRERDGGVESRARREGATTSSGTAPIPIGVPTTEPVSRAARTNGQANGNGVAGAEDDAMDVEEEEEVKPSPREPPRDIYRADFWRYKAVGPGRGKWERLSEDTAGEGGPKLLYVCVSAGARLVC